MKRLVFPLCLLGGLVLTARVTADTIYLKTGGVIEGKIFYNDGEMIKVRTAGSAIMIYDLKTQVERFEKDEKTGEDYLRRRSGVTGGKVHNPFGKKKAAAAEEEGENPYEDTTEVTPEEQEKINIQIRNLITRNDNRYLVRAVTRLKAIGYKAGRSLVAPDIFGSSKAKVRLRIIQILQAINYKPAVPVLISRGLKDADGFARSAAIDALEVLTGERRGFRAHDPLSLREGSIGKWETWWQEEEAKYLPDEPPEEGEGGEEGGEKSEPGE